MSRSPFLALAAMFTFLVPQQADACTCEDAWTDTVGALWQGEVLEPLKTDAITCPELRYLRNVPYARHGFVFGDNWIGEMFREHPRYQPDSYVTTATIEPMLTPADRQNIDMLVAAEAGMQCQAWWERNGEDPSGWDLSQSDPELEPEPVPTYAVMQDVRVGADGVINVTLGVAPPSFLIGHALEGKPIENEWLAPLACDELDRVEDALYARYKVDFEDPADEAFFAAATVGVYRPIPNLTRTGAEAFFSSQDKLTQLRVDRAQTQKGCSMEGE